MIENELWGSQRVDLNKIFQSLFNIKYNITILEPKINK